jgi:arylformamidase
MTQQSKSRKPTTWIDVSVPIRPGMATWPGDPPFEMTRIHDMRHGDGSNLSTVSMGLHTGTHIDAPLHFLKSGRNIEAMPPDTTLGRARVVEIRDPVSIRPDELGDIGIRKGERILFKTRNSSCVWKDSQFVEDFVYIDLAAARILAEKKVALVGVDYLSVGGYRKDGSEVHRTLLSAGIWIIEGLNLSGVAPGPYLLACLPLRIVDGEASPVRALLKPLPVRKR